MLETEGSALRKRSKRRSRQRPTPPRTHGPGGDPPARWRTIWISDLHLGTRACRAELLLEFLRRHESQYMYLVGDVVDGWSLRRSWYWSEDHNRVLQAILAKSSRGTRVRYVTGNHDEFLRAFGGLVLGGIVVEDETVHRTADGRELLVLHGDAFDACIRNARWLCLLGDGALRVCRAFAPVMDALRHAFGLGPWSLASYLKQRVKKALAYVEHFERAVAADARRRGFDGVVCGHIHQADLRTIDGVLYCNDGDWVESCTALVEDHAGNLSILRFGGAAHLSSPARAQGQGVARPRSRSAPC